MVDHLKYLLAATILLPATIGCIRFHKVNAAYFPFIICIILAATNEVITFFLASEEISSAYFFRAYSFMEAILLFVQFRRWRNHKLTSQGSAISISAIAIGYVSMVLINTPESESAFMIGYAVLLIILSLNEINYQLVVTTRDLAKNARVLISLGLLVFYTYAILIEAFWWYGLRETPGLSAKIYDIIPIINFFVNLTFAYAILWIPSKPKFILQSS